MKETLIDIETYSEVDIGKCGLYRYATDPSFELLLVAWATDEGNGFGGGVLMIEKLNERITIEKSTVVTDKVGNHRNTWEEYFTCFAYASTYQAQEEEGEVTAEQKSVVFTVRWCSETRGLTSTGYRIRFREQLYNIESVDPMNYQKKILKIHCRLERRQPDEQNRQHR